MALSHPDRRPRRRARLAVLAGFAAGLVAVTPAGSAPAAPATGKPTAAKPAAPAKLLPDAAVGLPPGNAQQPIQLEAASSDFDYRNNALAFRRVRITQGALTVSAENASATGLEFQDAEWTLKGNVRITVPGGELRSSEARVRFRDNAVVRATITGGPAEFEQQLRESGQVARGRAGAIDYLVKENSVRLTGDAWLSDGRNEIRGNTLVYDIAAERVQANPGEKDPGGVRITILPPDKTAAPAPKPGTGT